jgi:CubicO group peptidase (beta-lactamase class C family)
VTAINDPKFAELDAWIARRLAHDDIPGVTLALTTREKTIYIGGHGFADIASQTPVAPHHVFEIGSIGKSFTALLLLQMQDQGLIDVHKPVTDYLPWFSVQSTYEPITIHHLLTHTSGIIGGSDMAADGRFETWYLRETEVSGPPGESFHYSNVGYKTLGYLIENLLGKRYGDAVTEAVLQPLGMTESFSPITNFERPRIATPYRRQYDDRPNRFGDPLFPHTWLETGTADGGIACTPGDFAIYARALLNHDSAPVPAAHFASLAADYSIRSKRDPSATYGYGLMTWKQGERLLIGHSGGMVGHYAQLTIDPKAGLAAVGAVNGPASAEPYVNALLDFGRALLSGETPAVPEIRSRLDIENAETFTGEFANENITCRIVAQGSQLFLEWEGERVPLERHGTDSFFADHPSLDRDLIVMERDGEQIVALHHGPFWLGLVGLPHDLSESPPEAWSAYIGWYRSHNPWTGLVRVLERRGKLFLGSGGDHESELFPLSDSHFQIDASPSAERITFAAIADGVALRANIGGQAYYRTPDSSVESGKFVSR